MYFIVKQSIKGMNYQKVVQMILTCDSCIFCTSLEGSVWKVVLVFWAGTPDHLGWCLMKDLCSQNLTGWRLVPLLSHWRMKKIHSPIRRNLLLQELEDLLHCWFQMVLLVTLFYYISVTQKARLTLTWIWKKFARRPHHPAGTFPWGRCRRWWRAGRRRSEVTDSQSGPGLLISWFIITVTCVYNNNALKYRRWWNIENPICTSLTLIIKSTCINYVIFFLFRLLLLFDLNHCSSLAFRFSRTSPSTFPLAWTISMWDSNSRTRT